MRLTLQASEYVQTYSPYATGKEWKVEELLRQFEPVANRFGLQCQAGWIDLIYNLHEAIYSVYPEYKIVQIKEKLGTLRFYINEYPASNTPKYLLVSGAIHSAESKSGHTCEQCGSESFAKLRTMYGWYHTYCDPCELEYIENIHSRQTRELTEKELTYKQEIVNRINSIK